MPSAIVTEIVIANIYIEFTISIAIEITIAIEIEINSSTTK